LLDIEDVVRELADPLGHAEAVRRLEGEGPQDQEIERPLEQVGPGIGHPSFS
jgi:hypothetical protein